MLSADYDQLFARNVKEFCVKVLENGMSAYEDSFTLFYPLIGKDYKEEKNLLVIGQATNGWDAKFAIKDIPNRLSEVVQTSIGSSKEEANKCSLEWINEQWTNKDYSLFRSFFWNITYKLIKSFYGKTDTTWNNIMAWSNLMKIAPVDGGNPDNFLMEAQRQYSAKLFVKELEDLQPKNVLIMTNLETWAKPILDYSGLSYRMVNGNFVEALADYNNSKIIITKRGYLKVTHEQAINEVNAHLVR